MCKVSVDIACDHEGVSVLRKIPQPVHERAGLIFEIFLLMEPLGPSASHVCVRRGEPLQYAADAVGLGEVPVRLPEMGIGAEEVEPLRHVEPVASADDDQIRLGKRTADASRFHRFHALPPQRLAHVGEHVGDVGANGEPPILDRAGEKLRLIVYGDVARLRQLRREGPERLLDKRRCHAAHAQFQEKNLLPRVRVEPVGHLAVLLLVELALQEVTVAANPGERLYPAVRAARHELCRNLKAVSHGLYHAGDRLDRVPHLVGAAAGALEEAVIALDLGHLLPRVDLYELRVLVGGEHEEVLLGENSIEVLVGLTQRGVERGVEEGSEVAPARLGGGPTVERPLESAPETVTLGEFAEMPAIGRVVLVVEVAAARRGKPGGPAYKHAIGFLDHAGKALDLLVIGLRLAVAQVIGRAADSIGCLMGKRSVGELDNELLVRSHSILPFSYNEQVSISSINVDLRKSNEQLRGAVD